MRRAGRKKGGSRERESKVKTGENRGETDVGQAEGMGQKSDIKDFKMKKKQMEKRNEETARKERGK